MKPTIDELHNSGRYELIDSFRIDEMGQFLMRELGMSNAGAAKPTGMPKSKKGWAVFFSLGLLGGLVGYWIGSWFGATLKPSGQTEALTHSVLTPGVQIGLAFIGFFLILPIHELIHAAVFKYYKAPKVGFGGSWKSMIVYAYAQRFVHSSQELVWIAVMPFLVITAALLLGWALWPAYTVFFALTLGIHTLACIGDFVLINYHFKNRRRTVYTYDDIENEQRSYFFAARAH